MPLRLVPKLNHYKTEKEQTLAPIHLRQRIAFLEAQLSTYRLMSQFPTYWFDDWGIRHEIKSEAVTTGIEYLQQQIDRLKQREADLQNGIA